MSQKGSLWLKGWPENFKTHKNRQYEMQTAQLLLTKMFKFIFNALINAKINGFHV